MNNDNIKLSRRDLMALLSMLDMLIDNDNGAAKEKIQDIIDYIVKLPADNSKQMPSLGGSRF